jgi:peptidoglycan hydrolase CwlO-like protein
MQPDQIQKMALAITRFVGSPVSIVLHTVLFIASFVAAAFGLIEWSIMLLVLTTIVSLEAIYLAIFIQMTLNYTSQTIKGVEKDIDEIQEDIGEMQEDVKEIQEDVQEIEGEEVLEEAREDEQKEALKIIQSDLRKLMQNLENYREKQG